MNGSNWGLPLGGIVGLWLSARYGLVGADRLALLLACATLAGIAWRGGIAGLVRQPRRPESRYQALGVLAVLAGGGFAYWLLPEYGKPAFRPVWGFARDWGGPLLVVLALYLRFRPVARDDGLMLLGRALVSRTLPPALRPFLAGLGVRLFFAPLMLSFWEVNAADTLRAWAAPEPGNLYWWSRALTAGTYYLDLSIGVPAYLFASAGLRSGVRSTDTSAAGVAACMVCYPPFWNGVGGAWFPYDDDHTKWGEWLAGHPALSWAWFALVVASLALYLWAKVAMGFRFGNLSYKGLVDWGPYRWMRHPDYIGKNLHFWLWAVPWAAPTWDRALRDCLLLVGVNLIYAARAATEERHLARHPEYRDYARRVAGCGGWKPLARAGGLSVRSPQARA